ncbi:MAG: UbiA family prenyltransferase [Candidatus Hodarchaeota archaeon]
MKKDLTGNGLFKSYFLTIYSLIVLARPADGVIIGSTGVLGMIVGLRAAPTLTQMIMGLLGGIFLLGGMDTFNDYKDIESDRISKPWRPLPQGIVSPRMALIAAISETAIAIGIGVIFFEIQALLLGFVGIGLALAYSKWLKPFYLAKNVVVALSLSLALGTGALAVNPTPVIDLIFIVLQLLIFIAAFIFEIHKDLGDVQGDLIQGVKTIPTELGKNRAMKILILGYFTAWIIAASFTILLQSDFVYLGILLLTGVLILLVLCFLVKNPEKYIELTRRMTTLIMGFILLGLARLFLL